MSSQLTSTPRRELKPRQAETVRRLLDAGAQLLEEVGPEALTIRQVADRAGVSPATAYTYLSSKNHLIAELFLRYLVTDVPADPVGATPLERTRSVTRGLVDALAAAPGLSAGATVALLASDPDVERLRTRIGAEFVRRFDLALADPSAAPFVDVLVLAFSGALLQVGMGLLDYPELRLRMDAVVATFLVGSL